MVRWLKHVREKSCNVCYECSIYVVMFGQGRVPYYCNFTVFSSTVILQFSPFLWCISAFPPQFYRCFLALLCCEAPRRGSSIKSSSKVATKAMRGAAATGPRRTNDFLFMVASLGQPAATMPQLGPSFEATNDITRAPSSDTNKPVVVSLVAHFDGWWLATTLETPKVPSQEVMNNLRGDSAEARRAAACQSGRIWHCCCISSVLGSRDHALITKANLGLTLDNKSGNQRR